jgi:hypothetical protein
LFSIPKGKSLRLPVLLAALKRLDCFLFFFDCKRRIEPFFQKNVSGNLEDHFNCHNPISFSFFNFAFHQWNREIDRERGGGGGAIPFIRSEDKWELTVFFS